MGIRSLLAYSLTAFALAACHRPNADEHMSHMSAADMAVPSGAAMAAQGNQALPPSNNAAKARA